MQEREAPPLIDEYGLDIGPNTLTSLALQLVNISRHAYSGCDSASSHSITTCQKVCIQQSVREDCGCYHPLYQTEGGDVLPPCDLVSGSEDEECVLELVVKFDTGLLECSCLPACREKDYEKLVSSTVWPAATAATAISNMFGVDITDRKQVRPVTTFLCQSCPAFLISIKGGLSEAGCLLDVAERQVHHRDGSLHHGLLHIHTGRLPGGLARLLRLHDI